MSTSRVGETFDERPMTELMLLIGKDFVHFFWPRCGPRGPLISLQQRNAGEKKRLSCVGNKKENLWLLKVGLLKSPNCKSRLPVCRQCRPILKSH